MTVDLEELPDFRHLEVAHLGSGLAYLPTVPSVDGGGIQTQESSKGHVWVRVTGRRPDGEMGEVYVELSLQEAVNHFEQVRYMVSIILGEPLEWVANRGS